MRVQTQKLRKNNSTKAERIVGEILKRRRIKFTVKFRVGRYEADFRIGKVLVDVDGNVHKKSRPERDGYFVLKGYVPLHVSTKGRSVAAVEESLIQLIKANNIWQEK